MLRFLFNVHMSFFVISWLVYAVMIFKTKRILDRKHPGFKSKDKKPFSDIMAVLIIFFGLSLTPIANIVLVFTGVSFLDNIVDTAVTNFEHNNGL